MALPDRSAAGGYLGDERRTEACTATKRTRIPMKYRRSILLLATVLGCTGCATTRLVQRTALPAYKTAIVEERFQATVGGYTLTEPRIKVTWGKQQLVRSNYRGVDQYQRQLSPAGKAVLPVALLGSLAAVSFSDRGVIRLGGAGLLAGTLAYAAVSRTRLVSRTSDGLSEDWVSTPAAQRRVAVSVQTQFFREYVTDSLGTFTINLYDALGEKLSGDVTVRASCCDNPANTKEIIIPAAFVDRIRAQKRTERRRQAEQALLAINRNTIMTAQPEDSVEGILMLISDKVSTSGAKLKGAMWYLMLVDDKAKAGDAKARDLERVLLAIVKQQAAAIATAAGSDLRVYRQIGLNSFLEYYPGQADNLLKAFNNRSAEVNDLFGKATTEDAVIKLMRERVLAEKDSRLDAFTTGIENSLGDAIRKELDNASPSQ
jgi:hypothetical protein